MKIPSIFFFLSLTVVFSCNDAQDKKQKDSSVTPPDKVSEKISIIQLDERLEQADSLVFVFYDNPHGKDSLRYTRFYKQFASVDATLIDFIKSNLGDTTSKFEKIKKCRSEGKIWCFNKGEIFQTVYFSSFSTDCSFMYIIKNGQFYYSPISPQMSLKLKDLQQKATEPGLRTD